MAEPTHDEPPKGALLLLIIFLLLLVVFWTSIYLQLWQRGAA